MDRRQFLEVSTAAAATALLVPRRALADALTHEQQEKLSADEILELLRKGNERFARGQPRQHNYLRDVKTSAGEQHPAAVILSCIDSRVPVEIIMDTGIGTVFSARVAGNVLDDDVAGSIEFACKLEDSKVILILGHTQCGAVKGAIDGAKLGNLTGLLAKIRPAIDATSYPGPRTSKEAKFVDAVVRKNVELTMAHLRDVSPVVKELVAAKKVRI